MGYRLKDASTTYFLTWSGVFLLFAAIQGAAGMARVRGGEPFGAERTTLTVVALAFALSGITWPVIRRLRRR